MFPHCVPFTTCGETKRCQMFGSFWLLKLYALLIAPTNLQDMWATANCHFRATHLPDLASGEFQVQTRVHGIDRQGGICNAVQTGSSSGSCGRHQGLLPTGRCGVAASGASGGLLPSALRNTFSLMHSLRQGLHLATIPFLKQPSHKKEHALYRNISRRKAKQG